MGEVWTARDTKLDRRVALKFHPASFAEDALRLGRPDERVSLRPENSA
jgi:hypothetical protein